MNNIKIGKKLKVVFDQMLPGNEAKPAIKNGEEYECLGVFCDSKGNEHIDIGLDLRLNYVTSYATQEELPKTTHWCHPNRFIVLN